MIKKYLNINDLFALFVTCIMLSIVILTVFTILTIDPMPLVCPEYEYVHANNWIERLGLKVKPLVITVSAAIILPQIEKIRWHVPDWQVNRVAFC